MKITAPKVFLIFKFHLKSLPKLRKPSSPFFSLFLFSFLYFISFFSITCSWSLTPRLRKILGSFRIDLGVKYLIYFIFNPNSFYYHNFTHFECHQKSKILTLSSSTNHSLTRYTSLTMYTSLYLNSINICKSNAK